MFGDTQELAENKLLLLYIFDNIRFPVSNSIITELVLENNLLNYFHLQQYLSELVDSGFLKLDKDGKKQLYSISDTGKNALEFFSNRISDEKKDIVNSYLSSHGELLKKELQVTADYFPDSKNEYEVTCRLSNDSGNLIEIKLITKSNEQAKRICSRWKSDAPNFYDKIISLLDE